MPKYEWSKIPIDVDWVATDKDGKVWGYSIEPVIDFDRWGYPWMSDLPNPQKLFFLEPYEGDWEDSLEERPTA